MARAVALLALVALGNVTQTGPVHRQHRIEFGFYEPILFVLSQLKWLIAYFAIDFYDSLMLLLWNMSVSMIHWHLIYMDWFMVCTANLVVNVSYVSGKNTSWKEKPSTMHKTTQAGHQGWQADMTARLTRQSGLLALFRACLVCFLPAISPPLFCCSGWLIH